MEKRIFKILSAAALLFTMGCYPEGPEYVEELDVVYTDYDPEFPFSEQGTYAMPDSIVLINSQNFSSSNGSNVPDVVEPEYAIVILDQIRSNMEEKGWTEVDKDSNPDMILLVTASRTTNLYYNYDWNYWNWWYPGSYYGGYGGMGWYYPRYSPGGYITGYRSGSLMIQMTDASQVGANNNVPVVWLSVINGVLEGSTENINNRMRSTIDQAFKQSPYLNIK